MTSATSSPLAVHADPAFPALHPRPARGWLNDPNGICRWNDRYHVFFQHNETSARHDAIAWGHISSSDLLHWEEEPIALRPQPGGPDSFGCWTGVVTDDGGVPTAVYSGVSGRDGHSQVTLARGSADLKHWHQGGEVAAGMPDDDEVIAVRDPFLFHFDGARYAIQGAGLRDGRGALLLYDAAELGAWRYLGIWLRSENEVAAQWASANIWECPQLVEVDGRWLVIVSLWKTEDDEQHLSGVAHLIGTLTAVDGRPVFTPEAGGTTDDGRDFYAPQVVVLDDRALLWGWAWENRTEEEADRAGWAGLLTFPRELAVVNDALAMTPARELVGYRLRELKAAQETILTAAAEARIEPRGASEIALELRSSAGIRRVFSATTSSGVRIFVDASIVEIYRDGDVPVTLRVYPGEGEEWAVVVSDTASITAWELGI